MELTTLDSILEYFLDISEKNIPISPDRWVNAAFKMGSFLPDETRKLFDLNQMVAIKKYECISEGKSVAQANALVETLDIYKEMKIQKERIDIVKEQIRIAKLRSRMECDNFNI